MANNRIYLKCKICGNTHAFAKFYPSGGFIAGDSAGWYMSHGQPERMNEFFEEHQHDVDSKTFGGYQYELEYDVLEDKK